MKTHIDNKLKREFSFEKFGACFLTRYLEEKKTRPQLNKEVFREELAAYTNNSTSTVKDWFSRHAPYSNTLGKIAGFLRCTVDDLLVLSSKGNESVISEKMKEFGITDIKSFKVKEYTLWNNFKVYLKHRTDTPKAQYTMYLNEYCLCDISSESAENEERLVDIMTDIIDDDCIIDYVTITNPGDPEPELYLRKNAEKLQQEIREYEEYRQSKGITSFYDLMDPASYLKVDGLQ